MAAGNHPGRTASDLLSEHTDFVARHATGTKFQELHGERVVASTHRPTSDGGWVATHEDVTDRRRAEAKIIHMAGHDALTNLPNRILFREQMEQALTRVDRGEGVAVLYLDLDRFKGVNDTLGHPIGDVLLRKVTERLRAVVRETDTVARLGGDEFAILQIGAPQPTGATILATRVIEAIEELFDVEGHQVVIGASIGIAVAPNDGTEPDQLLKNADMALYRAKSTGRGTYHFFQPEMDAQMQARRILELDLRKAFVADQFELYYQPFVDLVTNKVSGFEALVRWNHPERGLVPPDEFIPLAEEIGLIAPLGEWVLKNACLEAATWPDHLSVAVNLSPAQLRRRTSVFSVVAASQESHWRQPGWSWRSTKPCCCRTPRRCWRRFIDIRQLGVRIAMDDFGTGYSSLSYLRSFPFDKIKIDRSFVGGLDAVGDSVAIIRAVTGLAGSLGMTTTAEGVETEEQLDILRTEGCTHVQGYLFSWPRPTKDIPALLRTLEEREARATGMEGVGRPSYPRGTGSRQKRPPSDRAGSYRSDRNWPDCSTTSMRGVARRRAVARPGRKVILRTVTSDKAAGKSNLFRWIKQHLHSQIPRHQRKRDPPANPRRHDRLPAVAHRGARRIASKCRPYASPNSVPAPLHATPDRRNRQATAGQPQCTQT